MYECTECNWTKSLSGPQKTQTQIGRLCAPLHISAIEERCNFLGSSSPLLPAAPPPPPPPSSMQMSSPFGCDKYTANDYMVYIVL